MSDRDYLSIGEVLALLQEEFPDITISKIRFLESQGLIDPERTPSGYRKFYDDDIERLRWILREQKEHFLPLKVIRDRLGSDEAAATGEGARADDTGPERAPAWLAASRRPPRRRTGEPAPGSGTVDATPTGVSFTFEELAAAVGLDVDELAEVERFGLIHGRAVGRLTYYDEDAFVIASLAARFRRHGVEPRHLRMYRTAAEREAGLFEQVILPLVKQRNPVARAQARATVEELGRLGEELHAALLRQQLRAYTEGR